MDDDDLGFRYRALKSGQVEIRHGGRLASTLRGTDAERFLSRITGASESEAQQLMARVTGNYKRGNERLASRHARNRGSR